MEAALELTDVSLVLRGQTILENVNLRLERGGFLGLIGPNGAGKSVLLRIILGLLAPTRGQVHVLGQDPHQVRGRVGYVPQYAYFERSFPVDVLGVVLMGRLAVSRFPRRYSAHDRALALECLARVDMDALAKHSVNRLSGGQLQRVLIARALAAEPELLLLDEPTASLDTRIGRNVYELLDELSSRMTIVLVSHDIGVISAHVKTIACLNRRLHYHNSRELSGETLAEVYGCPVELIAHGHAHRVLPTHGEHEHDDECSHQRNNDSDHK